MKGMDQAEQHRLDLGSVGGNRGIAATTLLFANRRHPPKAPDTRLLIAAETEIRLGEWNS